MKPLSLNLCVFETAKGHWSRTDIYKNTISDLESKFPLYLFENKLVTIKVAPGEEQVGTEIENWYKERGFKTIILPGQFSHFTTSHQTEYCKDMIQMFGQESLTAPYTLWLESDWCWDNKGNSLETRFLEAITYLAKNKDILTVRFPRFLNEVERLANLKQKHNVDVEVERNGKFINHNDNFSCNPNICRTRDLYLASLILKRNFDQFSHHSEMGFTKCLEWMSDKKLHYSIFDPSIVSVLHYGTKFGEEDRAGEVYEKI